MIVNLVSVYSTVKVKGSFNNKLCMLWFKFIFGLNFIFFRLWVWLCVETKEILFRLIDLLSQSMTVNSIDF